MNLDGASPVRRLPLMKSFEDAEALCQKEKEPFYLAAFMIQCWLGGLVQRAAAEYAEKKNPKERVLQSGEAWRGFLDLFGQVTAKGFGYTLFSLFRFCASDDSPGNSLRRALVPLSIEHDCTGDYFGPKTEHLMKGGHPATKTKLQAQGASLSSLVLTSWRDAASCAGLIGSTPPCI
jgi:hypothetical protein